MKKVLFISYYFFPDKTVAAQRVSYWAKNIKEHIDVEVDVITASPQSGEKVSGVDSVFHVSNSNEGFLGRVFKSDLGATWHYDLKRFFSTNKKKYDVVVITGNPFLHFFIARHLKRIMDCKIFLDFRDPFAKNERNVSNSLQVRLKRKLLVLFEYLFCSYADKVIVMNDACKKLLCNRRQDNIEIIDNGYDEKALDVSTPKLFSKDKSKKTIVYLGSFAVDRSINNLLEVNEKLNCACNILHVGRPLESLEKSSAVSCTGLLSYSEAVNYARGADIGLILASGKAFESTTKIFDYIGLELPILIITNGTVKTGNIHSVTKDYPKVWWAENNVSSIESCLSEMLCENLEFSSFHFEKEKFSRKHGLSKLASHISLENHV